MKSRVSAKACAIAALGSAIQAFGLYNIHSISGVTEGGILGLTLLLHHWFGISPALSSLVLNAACYILGVTLEMGLAGIGLGAPIASAASLVISVVFLLSGKWKKPVIR